MRRLWSYVLVSVLSGLNTNAMPQATGGTQGSEETLRKLTTAQTIIVAGQPPSSMLLPVRCDDEGNHYTRFFHGTNPQKEPVYNFDNNGVQKAAFSLSSDADFDSAGAGTVDFAVSKDGELFALAGAEKGNYIVGFDKMGQLKSKIKLEKDFNALRFNVFASGNLLVGGVDRETATNLTPHSPFTGIFSSDGKLLKKIVLAEDKQYEEAADRGDSDFFDTTLGGGGNFAVERGSVVRGSDGNMYVVRWTSPTKVYAISPEGEVIRSFEVRSQLEHKKPGGIHEHAGRLAIQFPADQDGPSSIVKVIGLAGDEYANYTRLAWASLWWQEVLWKSIRTVESYCKLLWLSGSPLERCRFE